MPDYWKIPNGFELRWRSYGDKALVYHPGPGDTHLLDGMGAMVLRTIEAQPRSLEAITEAVSGQLDTQPDNGLHAEVHEVIRELDRLGLVERERP